jgi:colanic acid biosynthesis glycosyl transferase WcaI
LYNVQEIYPDIAVSLGVLRNKIVLRLLTHLERLIYGRARKVIVISDGFRQRLLAKGIPNASLRVIPNHVDTNFIQPGERRNEFSSAHGLDDRFVILYAGNIGFSQDFDTLLDAAGVLAHLSNLRFLIVGDGARKAWLQAELTRRALSNVTLLPYQPRSLVPHIYASSDLCLAPMKRGAAGETFPSKIYTIMAAARPAIVCTEQESDLARLVIEAGCGWVAPPEDRPALAAAILKAYEQRNSLSEMGRNGRAYVLAHHSRQAVAQQYDVLLRELLP